MSSSNTPMPSFKSSRSEIKNQVVPKKPPPPPPNPSKGKGPSKDKQQNFHRYCHLKYCFSFSIAQFWLVLSNMIIVVTRFAATIRNNNSLRFFLYRCNHITIFDGQEKSSIVEFETGKSFRPMFTVESLFFVSAVKFLIVCLLLHLA